MNNRAKFLSLICLLIIFLGFGLIFFESKPEKETVATPIPSIEPIVEQTSVPNEELFLVTKVVDGDTIQVNNRFTIRLIGIDTPETVDPRRPVGCFGKEASNKAKELLSGKSVILEKDVSDTDKYQRLLRYVYLPLANGQQLFVNDYLVREGYGKVLTYPPDVKYNEQLREAETEAREGSKGLWGSC